jgi:hypothetical protein
VTRRLQTQAICRWTKIRKPGKAKAGPPAAAGFALLHAVNRLATKVIFSGVLFGLPLFMVRSLFRAH